MKLSTFFILLTTAWVVQAQFIGNASINTPEAAASVGTGPYPASFLSSPTLLNHTIYQPKHIPHGMKLPVLVWSNGGCISSGVIMYPFLVQLASQGIIVIVNGAPGNVTATYDSFGPGPRTTYHMLIEAMDWATANAGKGNWTHMDTRRIGVAGQSCGGIEAYSAGADPRATVIGIFNSGGNLTGKATILPSSIMKPIFYFLGGPTDIAYKYGEADYKNLPTNTPAWKGNLPIGHAGTYNEVNGGKIGVAASYWVDWVLRGNSSAKSWFTSNTSSTAAGWDVTSKNLQKIHLSPI
ncbi:uncharacterized protein PAC_17205 [Phialocephala subalpina]|uniref:Uncharacterized protein n=1 Tax=Phialocephala subalpina TaxID=576137 RepID=A0A1L7XQI4_9HELO|nr:uncharacterized protein PAC_17205 [Phialocephala subalpina]